MIENPTVLHNGYGIRDPQEYGPIPFKDICRSDVLPVLVQQFQNA
ncbi:hypothetical protein [Bacillus thuringiensis]|nr:hypothetical protein [Bacillus thuringiensis]